MRFGIALTLMLSLPAYADIQVGSLEEYCTVVTESASPMLVYRTYFKPKSEAEENLQGFTDQRAIQMAQDIIDYAYAQPAGTPIDMLKFGLSKKCLTKQLPHMKGM